MGVGSAGAPFHSLGVFRGVESYSTRWVYVWLFAMYGCLVRHSCGALFHSVPFLFVTFWSKEVLTSYHLFVSEISGKMPDAYKACDPRAAAPDAQ